MPEGRLMLIDGNSILNRAFYALQGTRMLAASNGLYTNAVFGFINILNKYMEEEKPGYICVAFDLKAPTFRHKEYDAYKAHRKGMPEELAVQVPVIKEVLDAMNIYRAEYEGFEADDLIGSISYCAEQLGLEVVIITGDRDSLQLAGKKTRIKIPSTRQGRSETEEYDYDRVVGKYGVTPCEFIDVKALMGDPSDNIPGVPGIGEKTALELITRFKSLENLYENIDKIDKKSVADKIACNRDIAFLSRRLSKIDRNMPEFCRVQDMRFSGFDRQKLYELFKKLEFKYYIDKFGLRDSMPAVADNCEDEETTITICRNNIKEYSEISEIIKRMRIFSLYPLITKSANFDYRINGIGIYAGEGGPYCIDLSDNADQANFLCVFREVLEDASIKKYGHDIKSFLVFLKINGIEMAGISFDTMIAAYMLDPSRDSYPLAGLSEKYLGTAIGSQPQTPGENVVAAAIWAKDIYQLSDMLGSLMENNGQRRLYYDIELPLVGVLSDMEYHGFRVDIRALREYSADLGLRIADIASDIYSAAGGEFNINSPKQLGSILFDKLKLPPVKKTKTGYSTDAEVLEQLAHENEIVYKILEYRQLAKLKATYADGLLNLIDDKTCRVHSSFNQTVTVTGRISSTEPNLQNIPVKLETGRKIRKAFIPENEDYILCDADYSQIELRILAHISGDENMISDFINDVDIHASTASKVFKVPLAEVTSAMRSRAKAVNFGIIYGIGDYSLSRDLNITKAEARKYIDDYLGSYPGVRSYMKEIIKKGRENGHVTTLLNRRRYIPELKSSNFAVRSFGERVALNTPIQGTAADIIKIAMVSVHNELKHKCPLSRLILQVHDELIVEAHVSEADRVREILKASMEKAMVLNVPLSVDVGTGRNWYDAK